MRVDNPLIALEYAGDGVSHLGECELLADAEAWTSVERNIST